MIIKVPLDEMLTDHFSIRELVKTDHKAFKEKNMIHLNFKILKKALLLAQTLEILREHAGKVPITVVSWLRCSELNREIGGSETSQHLKGEAVDIKIKGMTAKDIFYLIKKMVAFDFFSIGQCIKYKGNETSIHLSLPYSKVENFLYNYELKKRRT